MMIIEWLTMQQWSPYLAGAGIGILSWFTFLLSDKGLGCSTSYAKTAGMIESVVTRGKSRDKKYYKEFPPVIDWQWILVIGIIIGAFLSSILSGTFSVGVVPDLFQARFGDDPAVRILFALIGGILMGIGARWARGCTSGHGITGNMQLGTASLVASACFFAGGIAMAFILYAF